MVIKFQSGEYGVTGGLIGPPEAPGKGPGIGEIGVAFAAAGAVTSAIGAFYSVQAAQYQAKAQASSLEFEQWMSNFNARSAEQAAQDELRAGQDKVGRVGLQYGQVKATVVAKQAARGIQGGVGSAKEIAASVDLSKELDQIAITKNSVVRANARREQATNLRNRGLLAGVSAQNLRRTAGAMMPALAGFTSLLGGASSVAQAWGTTQHRRRMYESYADRGVS